MRERSPVRRRGWLVALIGLPVLVYLNSLQNPFQYDDFHAIAENPHLRDLKNLPAFFWDPTLFSVRPENAMYRPLLLVTYALNYAFSREATWSYHWVNLLLHLGSALLVWGIGRRLLGDETAAGLAALVFALHPVNSETLNYLSSRSEGLASGFFLLGFWLFLCRREEGGRGGAIAAAFAGGLLSKSIAIALPALFLTYDLLFCRLALSRDRKFYAMLGGIALLYLAAIWRFLHRAAVSQPVRGYSEQGWTQVKAAVFYLKLLLWPTGLSVDHQFLISDSLFDPFAASSFFLLASLFFLGWHYRRRHPLFLFLLLWSALSLAPSSLIPLHVLVNEHRLYLPSVGWGIAAGYCLAQLAARGRGWVLVGLTLAGYAGLVVQRNQVWGSEYSLWSDAAAKAPLMARPYIFLGEAHLRDGHFPEAMLAFEEVVRRDPSFAPAYVQLGELLLEQGEVERAEKVLRQGVEKAPGSAEVWGKLGEVYRVQGRWSECVAAYQAAVRLEPRHSGWRNNLGNALQMAGQPRQALEEHRRALELDPGDPRIWLNLGNAHRMLGEYLEARQAYQQAVALDSEFAAAWVSLGDLCERLGEREAALDAYEQGARADPSWGEFVASRRRALQGEGR